MKGIRLLFIAFLSFPLQAIAGSGKQNLDEFNPMELQDVVNSMRPREIKRILAVKHQYSSAKLFSLMEKEELVDALVQETRKAMIDNKSKNNERNGSKTFWTKVWNSSGAIVLSLVLFYLQRTNSLDIREYVHYPFRSWKAEKKLHMENCLLAGCFAGYVALALVFLIGVVQFLSVWCRLTVFASWVVPYSWVIVRSFFFPLNPNIPVNASMLTGKNGSGGGGGGGINVGSMLMMFGFRILTSWLEKLVVMLIKEPLRQARKEQRRSERREQKSEMKKHPKRSQWGAALNEIDEQRRGPMYERR